MSCKDCIHCSACMHARTAALDPYQSRPFDKDTGDCSDWLTCYPQEVKYSRWEYYNDTVRCMNCDHYTNDFYFDDRDEVVLPKYCSNCGCRMEE
uniref:Zinc-ribbon domain protein n=1 Tax=Siphoviridae sp. ctv4j104 TaxID=2826510 RepID=A0A8S5M9T4_9CAUD|nr:MAG TPA: zinc-ribbon domain protein [Siphoviridae sp. ctv4j104]